MTQRQHTSSIDPAEVAKFQAMAAEWWDPQGKFKPLHMLNPTRLDYVTAQVAAQFGRDRDADQPFAGLSVLDIGCGGGLMAEPMARLGATVTGADAAPAVIVQGRYDMVCPPRAAWELADGWHRCELRMVPASGHAMSEPRIAAELVRAVADLSVQE